MVRTEIKAGSFSGRFIVIDGPDGVGKTSQLAALADRLRPLDVPVITVHDPGDTPAGDLIRQILLSPNGAILDKRTETLLFMASRAQLVAEKIRPALGGGAAVLCDRFISATCAYQGAAGVDLDAILELGRFAVGDTWPDLTVVLDLPAEEGLRRIGVAGQDSAARGSRTRDSVWQGMLFRDAVADSMEARSLDFHRRVREIFRALPGRYPRPVELVDASGDPRTVHDRVWDAVTRQFG